MTRPRAVRAARWATALALVLSLGACASPPSPAGSADQGSVMNATRILFLDRLAALDRFTSEHNPDISDGEWNVIGNYYTLVSIDGEDVGQASMRVGMMGNPAAVVTERSQRHAGTTVNKYHPSGSEWDFEYLGEDLVDLAPTRWVAIPAPEFRGNPGFLFDLNRLPYTEAFCSETTVSIMCGLRGAIYTGISTGSPEVLSSANVVSGPDGSSELTLEIPFDFIGNRNEFPYHPTLLPIPSVQALNLPELLAGQPIMIHLWLTAEGEPVKVEANGEMTADGKNVRFQAGWEKLREATIADFPEPPSALDVTYLTAEEASQLTNRIIERQEELSE